MIVILSEPTEKDIELVKRILGDKSVSVFEIATENQTAVKEEWLSPQRFRAEMEKRGYKCKDSKTRKKLCIDFRIPFEKRGQELWFKNEFHRIQARTAGA